MIPSANLDGLTSEDLRLLLNGVGDINVQTLISYTSFNDESGMYIRGLDLGSCGGGRGGTSWAYVVFIMSVGTSHLGGTHL